MRLLQILFAVLLTTAPLARTESDTPIRTIPQGGWAIDDDSYSISYQPTRHADRFMQRWLDLTSELTQKNDHRQQLFTDFVKDDIASYCVRCHVVDERKGGQLTVNWTTKKSSSHPLTRFSHTPHILLNAEETETEGQLKDQSCVLCHTLTDQEIESNFADEEKRLQTSAESLKSNFSPITTKDCTACHNQEGAREQCTTCHTYHMK